ncbi:MAG: hypothetical protein CVU46_00530 [Chloroflexi bacterium HGW-Chloroflexi-8]|nr:MAG: hypothetical protein CVU46_00530 [Chloroflexi bacterium HGW-Chloroflexi-8]
MENRVLVISSYPAFGKSIQISLAESNDYAIDVVFSWEDLEKIDSDKIYDLLIIDIDSSDTDWIKLIVKIQNNLPFVKTIVFHSDINSKYLISQQIKVDTFCDKPFYLPDFLKEIKALLVSNQKDVAGSHQNPRRILFTDNLKELRLSLDFAFEKCNARQIIYYVNELAFASTGSLSEFVILDLATFLKSRQSYPKHTDLVRYKRFIGDTTNFLVYLRSVSESDTLVMIFDGDFPIQKAKAQVNYVVKYLQDPGNFDHSEIEKKAMMSNSIDEDTEGIISNPTNGDPVSPDELSDLIEEGTNQSSETDMATLDGLAGDLTLIEDQQNSKTTSVEEISTESNPEIAMFPHDFMADWIKAAENWEDESKDELDEFGVTIQQSESNEEKENAEDEKINTGLFEKIVEEESLDDSDINWADLNQLTGISFPWEEDDSNIKITETEEINSNKSTGEFKATQGESSQENINQVERLETSILRDVNEFSEKENIQSEDLEKEKVFANRNSGTNWFHSSEITGESERISQIDIEQNTQKVNQSEESSQSLPDLLEDELGKTKPRFVKDPAVSEQSFLQPFSPGLNNLSYTFYLLPKFPDHFLSGSLAKKMGVWIPDLTLAYGWRLDKIMIRPLYLSCTISASPNVAPGKMINRIRKETSKQIFKAFPVFFENNPSKDFWAPGYMLINGNYTPSNRMIVDFIKQTRNYQGISLVQKT